MGEMTLREKIGHMIMTGFQGEAITPSLNKLIAEYHVSNIILFSYNLKSKEQILRLCRDLNSRIMNCTGYPALIATDQEGGVVTRLPKQAANIPGAMLLGATGHKDYAYEAGRITGAQLKNLGINMNLAPVLDINTNPFNPVIGVRSYSGDAGQVKEFGLAMMKGLLEEGVIATAKHFPGHGDTSVDSHLGLPVVKKGLEELMAQELLPFHGAVKEDIPCIMTSHILFPGIEKEPVPATMSETILKGILRERLGFQGVIITDCLEMGAIKDHFGTAQGAVSAVKAGAQLLCISHTPELVIQAMEKIEETVRNGEISMDLIDRAVDNILFLKRKFQINPKNLRESKKEKVDTKKIIEEMTLSGITKLTKGELPKVTGDTIFIGSYPYRSTLASSVSEEGLHFAEYMADKMNCSYLKVPVNPSEEERKGILKELKPYPFVVYGLYNGHLNQGQTELANAAGRAGHKVLGIALRNPYDLAYLDKEIDKLAAYEYNTTVFNALVQILNKEAEPKGTLPVHLAD